MPKIQNPEAHRREAIGIGERIRFYRVLRRKTLRGLATEVGCDYHTIWRAEKGLTVPNHRTRERIAQALGVSSWDLYVNPLPERPEEVPQLVEDHQQITVYEALKGQMSVEDPLPSRAERRRKERNKQRRKKQKGKRKK